ncbi:MAG TPA: 6,7-dimethyl-8-ribityllumazine synthase [Rhodanobacteraceae bacterium]|nr:6,7-dimethyl-8-ribityllumazine synthase [Rhodanobacteraceae bacterium]
MSIRQAHADPALRSPPGARYAVIASRWNPAIVEALLEGARRAFTQHGVVESQVEILRVPGAWELPVLAAQLARSGNYAAIVALGCVVRGETRHYEHVADECARGLMRVALDHQVPVLNGVLAVEREADALARAGGAHGNKGADVAQAAIEMAATMERTRTART